MTQFKGTPGPWHPINFIGLFWIIMHESDDTTDSESIGYEKAKANAYLQAAAPELLEALQDLVQLHEWEEQNGRDEHYEKAKPRGLEAARAAINKALNQEV